MAEADKNRRKERKEDEERRLRGGEVDDHEKEKKKNKRSCCYVPEEILREICFRLPVKTLLRFRSIDKRLRHLISTKRFATDHLNTFRPKEDRLLLLQPQWPTNFGCCLFLDGLVPTHVEDIPPMAGYYSFGIVGYCDGVACLICRLNVLFLNPSIRKAVAYSHLPDDCVAHGFGSVDDDYKLVAITGFYERPPLTANVFSLKTRSWETVTCSWPETHLPYYYVFSPVFMNGVCHWLSWEYDDGEDAWEYDDGEEYEAVGRNDLFLLSFHLGGDHVSDKIAVPSSFCRRCDDVSLHVYEGCLSMMVQKDDRSEMWLMKEYDKVASWTKIIESTHFTINERIVGFTGRGDIVYRRRLRQKEVELACYNPTSKTTQSMNHVSSLLSRLVAYKESLVLLNQN